MLILHAHVHVRPEAVEAFIEATLANARASRLEPGILGFDVIQQLDDPTRFVLLESYRDPEDQARHRETQHYQTWRDTVQDWMAEPRVGIKYRAISPAPEPPA